MGKSRLKKSAPECPFECGGGGVNAIWAMPTWGWWQVERCFPKWWWWKPFSWLWEFPKQSQCSLALIMICASSDMIIWTIFIMDSFITVTVLSADKVQLKLCPMLPSKSCSRWVCYLRQESHCRRQGEWQRTVKKLFWVAPGGDTGGWKSLPHNGEFFHLGRLARNQPWHRSPSCWWRPPLPPPCTHWVKSPRPIMVRISSIFVKG